MTISAVEINALAATEARKAIPPDTYLPIVTAPPFVPSRSLFNMRDVGAVPDSGVPAGLAFRCGALDHVSKDPDAVAWLTSHVKKIFDLRKEGSERDTAPDPVIDGIENVWLPSSGTYPTPNLDDFAKNDGKDAWRQQYMNVARMYRPTFKAVLEHIRDEPTVPFLFHCTAGRDRTGVLAGLLHHLAGSKPEVARNDYMLSRIGIEPARDQLLAFAMKTVGVTDPETPGFYNLVDLRPEFWQAFLDGLNEEYGGWDGYVVKGLGLSEEDLAKVKKNLQEQS